MSTLYDALIAAAPERLSFTRADHRPAWHVLQHTKKIGEIKFENHEFLFIAPAKRGALVQVRSNESWKTLDAAIKALVAANERLPSLMHCKCQHCNKTRGEHRAVTFECPAGAKARAVGYTSYGPSVFSPKPATAKDLIKAMAFTFTL